MLVIRDDCADWDADWAHQGMAHQRALGRVGAFRLSLQPTLQRFHSETLFLFISGEAYSTYLLFVQGVCISCVSTAIIPTRVMDGMRLLVFSLCISLSTIFVILFASSILRRVL